MSELYNIPIKLAEVTELNWNDKALYNVYHYLTFCGNKHASIMTNEKICQMLGMALSTMRCSKKRLLDKGYIKTDGNTTVTALIKF